MFRREAHLTLPDCNSFYRMLSHRLADYYGLEHTHHPRDSGTAVLISKTPHSRVYVHRRLVIFSMQVLTSHRPPALAGLPVPGTQCSSPPPQTAARKIMRRGDDGKGMSGPSTTANSEGASKATSEAGDGASELGRSKDKSSLTREERERLYAEARLRILGAAEPESEDTKKAGNETDLSRSSSASGKKKSKKRKDDDDFEPRSQFPGYYTPSYQNNGYSDGSFYFPQYGGMMTAPQQYPMVQTASSPSVGYPAGYPQVDQSGQMPYMTPQQYGTQAASGMNGQSYVQPQSTPYDLSAQFQTMSFGGPNPASLPQKPGSSSNFPTAGQMQQPQQGWASQYDSQQYMYNQQMYPSQYSDRSISSPATPPTISYPFGQLPNPALQNGKSQHPLPGSFNRQQFNPQTQAFVPGGGRSGSMPVPMPNQNSTPYFNPFGVSPNGMQTYRPNSGPPNQGSQHRSPPVKSNTNAFPPPNVQQPVQAFGMNTPTMHFSTMAQHTQAHHDPSMTAAGNQQRPSLAHVPSNDNRPLAHPLPQPPNPESSIAKWGTPAHLPPKPPTPQNQYPTKFLDINKNMSSRNVIPGMSRSFGGSAGTN